MPGHIYLGAGIYYAPSVLGPLGVYIRQTTRAHGIPITYVTVSAKTSLVRTKI